MAVLSDSRGNPFYGKEGDIIEGRYRVLRIASDSVDVAYADGRGQQTLRLSITMTNAAFISLKRPAAVFVVAILLAGCGGGSAYKKGFAAAQNGDWDGAVEQYRIAVQEHPNNPEYKIALERAMLTASQQHVDAARLAEARMQWEEALREYRRASELDPPNRMLAGKVSDVEHKIRDEVEASARSRSTLEQMRETARRAGPPPLFNLNTVLPAIRLSDTSLRTILNAIAQAAGINVQYDTSFNDRPFSVNLENVTLQDALNQVLLSNGLFFKVLNQRTIIVAQDSLAEPHQGTRIRSSARST